jgi:hypothetical protein
LNATPPVGAMVTMTLFMLILISPFRILDFFVTRDRGGAGLQGNFTFEESG